MNESWQLVTADMMDWVREADRGPSSQPTSGEWVFALEQTNQEGTDVRAASRRRRAGRAKYLNRMAATLSRAAYRSRRAALKLAAR